MEQPVATQSQHEATGAFVADGPLLFGGLREGASRVWRVEPAWMVLEVVRWGYNHHDNRYLSWCGANFSMVSGFYGFFGGFIYHSF